jgi:hypothetical protein
MYGECYLCGRYAPLERHHVFNGPFRAKSEKYGAVVDLCHFCHNEPPDGVHFDQEADTWLKSRFQKKLMELHEWTKEEFIEQFGRSYL